MSSLTVSMDEDVWKGKCERLLDGLYESNRLGPLDRAGRSSHGLYSRLNYGKGRLYVMDELGVGLISWVLRARGGMIGLNSCPWRDRLRRLCSLCNGREEEDVVHFLGRCPILGGIRCGFFGVSVLDEDECVRALNGEARGGWDGLVGYLRRAWRLRSFMTAEFNL